MFFSEKKIPKIRQFTRDRIKRLEKVKRMIIELLDDFLSDVDFYKLNNEIYLTEITSWTAKNRYDFIIKSFQLSDIFAIIDYQISIYEGKKIDFAWGKFVDSMSLLSELYKKDPELLKKFIPMLHDFHPEKRLFPPRLKPLNQLLLIWSYAMTRGEKVDWINMENLLNWFSKRLKEIEALEFLGIEEDGVPSPEILRLTRNKYKKSTYDLFAKIQFDLFFNLRKEEGKEKFPKPLDDLDEFLKCKYQDSQSMKRFLDFYMLLKWLGKQKMLRNFIKQKK